MDLSTAGSIPLISIVIPVKNGESWLQNTLDSIFAQTLISKSEVIIIDSGSTDRSLDIIRKFNVRLISIHPRDFNHGETRNLGVRHALGKYVVMTVQDASPENERWLELLMEGFTDESIAGVCGQQIVPHDLDKNPIDWFRPATKPSIRRYSFDSAAAFNGLPPSEKKAICSWDDVNAAYRKDVLLRIPFRKISFAEDALWARDVLNAGYAIVYHPNARVRHYHLECSDYTFRRTFTVSYHYFTFFDVKPQLRPNGIRQFLQNFRLLLSEDTIPWSAKMEWLRFNCRQRAAINKAVRLFHETLAQGVAELDKKHLELCELPPQAASKNDLLVHGKGK